MQASEHDQIARWERRWLAASAAMSLVFVLLIAYNLAVEGTHIAQRTVKASPEEILAQPVFAEPGVRQLSPGAVQVTTVAQAFAFVPSDVRVPVGADVTFIVTARDVIHGYQIERTNVNVEVIPGEVSTFGYVFDEPGVYRITCNEYCGIGHHDMLGTVTVVPASQWGRDVGPEASAGESARAYATHCASCHQGDGAGIRGAFPPVAGHAADLTIDLGREYLPLVLLYGLQGAIEIDGATYDGVMPAWSHLADESLALLANYVTFDLAGDRDVADVAPYVAADFAALRGLDLNGSDVYGRRNP